MDGWIAGDGRGVDKREHFSWHAALHELSMGDLGAVARRYEGELRPRTTLGCRALVDAGALLWRWSLTPGATSVPPAEELLAVVDPAVLREVVAPLADALRVLTLGRASAAADALGRLQRDLWRVGGSDAQREVVEETRIAALLRSARYDDARVLVDARLDRRRCRRDEWFEDACRPDRQASEIESPSTVNAVSASASVAGPVTTDPSAIAN